MSFIYNKITPITEFLDFNVSQDGTNVNLFPSVNDYDFSQMQVYINDRLTNQSANSLTFNANDNIKIKAHKYPRFASRDSSNVAPDYILKINRPLPTLYENDISITDFSSLFRSYATLTEIPSNLFKNNKQITKCQNLFRNCQSFTSIPENLFDGLNIDDFSFCFRDCINLINVPENLFLYNYTANNFSNCFRGCTNLQLTIKIGTKVEQCGCDHFARECKTPANVYAYANYRAYKALLNNSTANVVLYEL